ncbi:conserved hypothetical protein [Candidatus Terasakiella magnetica]|uniref:Uncharacterized protein n=1 Tax=Candidatus Terasakiella magnetica TaxID=1867952 RepID=A0A1C3RJC2_9PROT|nr:DUF3887 domain-containing protein [Candidatus Terasakiella magnetica]SCA57374.1 conserved hypothetical protein [Candidatus Terasakiella magnetica]
MENYFGKLGTSQEEALTRVTPIVDSILKAQDEGDYEGFCASFEAALKNNITKDDFLRNQQNIVKTMGTLAKKEFLTTIHRDGQIGFIYKARFSVSENDFIITITFNDEDKPKACGIWIS